jgi:membrane fusion protein (multidrug efflux system)
MVNLRRMDNSVKLAPDNEAPSSSKRHAIVIGGFFLFAVSLAAIAAFTFSEGNRSTNDAYVTGHVHPVSSRVNGTVERVLVGDNQLVRAGQVLVVLDHRDFEVRVALERSRIEQARAGRQGAAAAIAQAQAAIRAATADARKADLDFDRARELTTETPRGLSRQEYDAANAARTSAHAKAEQAAAQLVAARAALDAAQAQEAQGDANLRDASLQLEYSTIVAPVTGYVGRKTVETGQRVGPGQPLLSIVEPSVWIVANFRETQLAHVRPGDLIEVRIDARPGVVLRAHVDSLSPATGGEFALLPPDNATGNFTKVVQRIPVKIVFDRTPDGRLAPGLSAAVTIVPKESRP